MEIKDKYMDSDGKVYNIRNVNFDINSPIQFFGEKVAETSKDYTAFLGEEDYVFDGVYICKTSYDPKKALRIYKDWAAFKLLAQFRNISNYRNLGYSDHEIVSMLQEKQKDIKLTEFPTGIVTYGDIVIGQEIPYYEGHIDLNKEIENLLNGIKDDISYKKNTQMIMYYYQKLINILEELTNKGIYYKDLHPKNFVVKNESLKLIDFETGRVDFDCTKKDLLKYVKLVRKLFLVINSHYKIDFTVEGNTFNEMREDLLIKSKRIK